MAFLLKVLSNIPSVTRKLLRTFMFVSDRFFEIGMREFSRLSHHLFRMMCVAVRPGTEETVDFREEVNDKFPFASKGCYLNQGNKKPGISLSLKRATLSAQAVRVPGR